MSYPNKIALKEFQDYIKKALEQPLPDDLVNDIAGSPDAEAED